MTESQKKRAAKIMDSIREVLYRDWNPIGAPDLPKNEYDSYIGPVYRILATSRSEQELIDYLSRTERDSIGMPCKSPELLRPVARKLLELNIQQ